MFLPNFPHLQAEIIKKIIYLYSRAISVILGDKWKKMKNEERRMYTMEAKALAEEQKRLNPDCWKRKRTNSVKCPFLLDSSEVLTVRHFYRQFLQNGQDYLSIYLSMK